MKKSGFTLIEVVIVIALISIISSVLVPAYEKAGERAKNVKLMSDLKVLDAAIVLYRVDNGKLPTTLKELEPEYISGVMSLRTPQTKSLEILDDIANDIKLINRNSDLITSLTDIKTKYPTCTDFEKEFISLTFPSWAI